VAEIALLLLSPDLTSNSGLSVRSKPLAGLCCSALFRFNQMLLALAINLAASAIIW
jgi:hypothetical protein